MVDRVVSAYSVTGPRSRELNVPKPEIIDSVDSTIFKVYDFETGETVHEGRLNPLLENTCPDGKKGN